MPTDLATWWPQVLAPGQLAAQRKGLGFDARWQGEAPTVALDATRSLQVVQNLVMNAVKFTARGRVGVTGELRGTGAEGRVLWVQVSDTGPGLSASDRARLFLPYSQGEQGRAARQGAGLGLAICRQLVQGLGGQIAADAAPDGGARFSISLPVRLVPAEAGSGSPAALAT